MIKKLLLIVLPCIIAFSSCTSKKNEQPENGTKTIVIDEIEGDKAPFSNYFKVKKVVVLETRSECLVGEIDKIFVAGNRIYISDSSTKSILVFTDDGEFLFKLHNIGKGPGEYLDITDFQVDDVSQELTLYDIETEKLITYSAEGKFLMERPYKYSASEFVMFDNTMAFYCANSSDAIYMCVNGQCSNFLIEMNDEIIFRACPVARKQMGCYSTINQFNAIQYSHNNVYLTEPLGHIIYTVYPDRIDPEYIIDYGARTIPSDLSDIEVDFNYIYQFNHSITNIYEDDEMLFFEFDKGMLTKGLVMDKQKDSCNYVNTYRNTDNNMLLNLISVKGEHNYLVSLIDPTAFFKDYTKQKSDKISALQKVLKAKLTPENNPALVLYERKINK